MPSLQNAVFARPRGHWGEKVSLIIPFMIQVLAVLVLVSAPFLMDTWVDANSQYSISDRGLFFYAPYGLGLVFFATSLWVFSQRRNDAVGQVYSLFAAATAISLFSLFDIFSSQRLFPLWVFSIALSGGALINLALIYPEQARINLGFPTSRYLGYFPSLVLILLALLIQFFSGSRDYSATIVLLAVIFILLALSFFLVSTLARRLGSPSPIVREQSRLILWGYLLASGPFIGWFIWQWMIQKTQISPILLLSISIFPIFLAYTILRYRTLRSNTLLKTGIIYGGLMVLIAGSYALLVGGLSVLAGTQMNNSHPFLVGIVVFLIALLIYPLREGLQSRVDAAFYKGAIEHQNSLQTFSHQLTSLTNVTNILSLLRNFIDTSLSPSRTLVYMMDETSTYYVATQNPDGSASSEIHFARSGSLVELLSKQAGSIYIGDNSKLPDALMVDQARIAVLQAELFVPITGQTGMIGWLALGMRRSGDPYSLQDIHYLESLCDQASMALERSQVVAALEKRVHEMDTITKVAEQINQKLALDDLLDMFYSETRNLVPTVDFRITLRSNSAEEFHHVFYISQNKRSIRRENQPFLAQHSLETVVIENKHPIVTVDYSGECRRRGITPESKEIHAWMSVPLNAGQDTIGAVCVGSRDPAVIYTSEQVNLLQAIADLVAGAIVKTRLLDESQKQARQMAALNELTRSLTSTLELDLLLNRIMEGAVEILDCEAGSLLMVDEKSGESVFEVAVGPVSSNLIGKRLPSGVGLVGKAIEKKQAFIENDVRSSDDWFNADQNTGFSSKDLLVVPLVIKDHAIGVLEVLNKKDESPFNQNDLELLSAFAGQMAVAIENARLYTQTDLALASRVDELSIMQQIDQELNASLDIGQVMTITVDAAMRHSLASAGLIGLIENGGTKVVAARGFTSDQIKIGGFLDFTQIPGILDAIDGSQNYQAALQNRYGSNDKPQHNINHPGRLEWLSIPNNTDQILVPIRLESGVNGIIFLVSTETSGFTSDHMEFLNRLSDHAAIAISNAQLYAKVQSANETKSEFVSAAAHELKNPLTSIKGYSDLLVSGAVGPISEGQAEFLRTIRANAERMRTLVSDLQDISRIEANQLQLQVKKESFAELIQEVITSFEAQIADKQQTIEVQIADHLPNIACDNTRMVQVLTNLVSNAHKYSPESGHIVIAAREGLVNSVRSERDQPAVQISITDNGYGISKQDQERIFEQFFRSEDSHIRESTGTGLGLSITKKLVELQGGKLWFESELGVGTTFHFTIPTAKQDSHHD